MKDPRTAIIYDFDSDNDDIKEYVRSLRRLHPADEYPFFGNEGENYDDDDHTTLCWIEGGSPNFDINGKKYYPDRTRRCRGQGYYLVRYV